MIKSTFDYQPGDTTPINLLDFEVDFENVEPLNTTTND